MPYLTVIWTTEPPASREMSWGNLVFLASGNTPSQCSNPQLVTTTNYTDYLASNSHEYTAFGSYKKNFPGTPTNNSYVYWLGGGSGITGILEKVTDIQYKMNLAPFTAIDKVYLDPTGGQNWQLLTASDIDFLPNKTGYYAETGTAGKDYNGLIDFTGDILDGGPSFNFSGYTPAGLWTGQEISGANARAVMTASGGHLRAMATQGGFGVAQKALADYDIQFIVPLYNVAGDGTGLENTPAFNDCLNALTMAAGNRRMVIWALPKAAVPNTTYGGTGKDYNQFRNYVGQDRNAIVIYADVTTGTTATGLDDPAAALAGRICSSHPHTPQTLDTITMSLTRWENENDKAAWDGGKIVCVFRKSDLGFTADQINYGFTFGATSPSDRIENVRCKYIVEYNVLVDLWKLLSSKTVRVNKAGLNKIIDKIKGTLARLLSQGIIDDGNQIVRIPLLESGTAAEWSTANETRTVPSIIVRWPWSNSVESLIITEFGEII